MSINVENLASELQRREAVVEAAEKALADAKKELRALEEDIIPDVFAQAELSSVKLLDGRTMSIVNDVHASITKERKDEAYAWLRYHDYGDLIKTKFAVSFSAGESPADLVNNAVSLGLAPSLDESIHPSTYKAFCKDLLFGSGAGLIDNVPTDVLGIFCRKIAKVK